MKKSLSIVAIAAVFGASLIYSVNNNYVPVKAADVSDTNTLVNNQGVSDKTWSKKLVQNLYLPFCDTI